MTVSTVPRTFAGEGGNAEALALATHHASRRRRALRRRLLPLGAVLALVVLWEAAVRAFGIRPFIAPAPSAVAEVFVTKWAVLLTNLVPTAIEAVLGFLVGNLGAVTIATVFVHQRTTEEAFFPVAVMIHTVPVMAYAPILVLLLGNGMEAKIAIAALICFFPTLVNMTRGLRDVSPQQLELMRILSASQSEVFLKLRLTNSLPYLFSAFKIAASTSVIGAIVGEWIGADRGIGALIIQSTYNFNSPLLYATIVVGAAFSGLFFWIISLVEQRVVRWNPSEAP